MSASAATAAASEAGDKEKTSRALLPSTDSGGLVCPSSPDEMARRWPSAPVTASTALLQQSNHCLDQRRSPSHPDPEPLASSASSPLLSSLPSLLLSRVAPRISFSFSLSDAAFPENPGRESSYQMFPSTLSLTQSREHTCTLSNHPCSPAFLSHPFPLSLPPFRSSNKPRVLSESLLDSLDASSTFYLSAALVAVRWFFAVFLVQMEG